MAYFALIYHVASDPYVKNGLVARYEIRDWYVVIADDPMPV
jgi:uncharacterized protein YciI